MPKTHIELPLSKYIHGCDCDGAPQEECRGDRHCSCECHLIETATRCGMFRHEAGMPGNRGNRFELAARPFEATCLTCRTKAGLPKTVQACRLDDGTFSGHSLIDAEVYTHSLLESNPVIGHSEWTQAPLSRASLPMLGPVDWKDHPAVLRKIISQCPCYNVLVVFQAIGKDQMRLAVLRRLNDPFEMDFDDYKPNFDLGLPEEGVVRTVWERLLDEDPV